MAEERIKQLEQELAAEKLAKEETIKELAETQALNEEKDRQLQAANEEKDRELAGKDRELEDANAEIAKLKMDSESRLEEVKVRLELDKLRAIEQLRNEHMLELKSERQQQKEDQVRADSWINDLKAHFGAEKERLLDRIRTLEEELKLKADSAGNVPRTTPTTETSTPATTATAHSGTSTVTSASETIASTATVPSTAASSGDSVVSTATCESTSTSTSTSHTSSISTTAGGGAKTTVTSTVCTITTPAVAGSTTGDLQLLLGEFLEAQKRVMVQAAAAQNLPTLPKFSGEGNQDEDNSFSRWHESFEERALLTGWTPEQKLCQLKAHLEKTALEVFRMMPESERTKYDAAVGALKKRFRRVDIQELRGLEFCRKLQGDESVEQLGMDLQRMARRAFSNMPEVEFNRLLKGRFFQALQVKW